MNHDENLQDHIEKKLPAGDSVDARAYRKVFEALEQEPWHVRSGFADQVLNRMEVAKRRVISDDVWIYCGVAALVVAAITTALLLNFRINFGAFHFISGYAGLFIFGIVFILGIQWIDRTVLHGRHSSR